MSFDFGTLITDRSQQDLDTILELLATPLSEWSDEQSAEFDLARSRGNYDYTDFNRVIACMDYLNGMLTGYGYTTGYKPIKVRDSDPNAEVYTVLEYIQSDGTQCINTGFVPNQDTRIVMDVQALAADNRYYFGARTITATIQFAAQVSSSSTIRFRADRDSVLISQSPTERITLELNKNIPVINGEQRATMDVASFNPGAPIALLTTAYGSNLGSSRMSAMLYSCQIYDNDTLVRDYVPVRSQDNEVGLFDQTNSVFYPNAGTGVFTAGPETGETIQIGAELLYTWTEDDIPTASQMAQYIANIAALRGTIAMLPTTPSTPDSMELLDYIKANNIEQILIDINQLIINMAAAWFYSGDLYSGEV